jgi:hypothetical protein
MACRCKTSGALERSLTGWLPDFEADGIRGRK